MSALKQKIMSGVFWRTLERFGTQGIGLAISMVLARLLGPEEYGTVALLSIFLMVSNVFVDSGFGKALIQRKNADELDFNTIFFFNIFAATVIYCFLFFIAPWVADFYDKPILVLILRISALNLVIGSLNCVQNALLIREMRFHLSFMVSLAGILTHGAVGITLAYLGYGVWSLVFSQLAYTTVSMVARWLLIGWHPRFCFSIERLKNLFGFSSKLLYSELLDTGFNQMYGLLIGKIYSPADLAYYNRGDTLPGMIMGSIQGVIGSVVFPALSSIQDQRDQMKKLMRRALSLASFVAFPAMFGLAAVARPLVALWLSEKWLPAVPYVQIACFTYAFWPVHVANLQVIQACGRSDIFFRMEIAKRIILVIAILLTFQHGVMALVLGRAATAPIGLLINVWPNKKLIGYSFGEQCKDLFPFLLLASVMAGAVAMLSFLPLPDGLLLLAQVMLGGLVYLAGSWFVVPETVSYMYNTIRSMIKR